jgi:Raf kinase inhibitor-like YbhB/YbcL family protein
MKISIGFILILSSLIPLSVCAQQAPTDSIKPISEAQMKIASPAFKEGEFIPVKYTCDGPDLSPPLSFSDIPDSTKSLALICDDPDAPVGDWVHWVVYGIPPSLRNLPENVIKSVSTPLKIKDKDIIINQGKNDFGKYGYGGPCPPKGSPHRYFFKLFALDLDLKFSNEELRKGISKKVLLEKIRDHVLAEASLMGKYQRKQ